MEWLILLLLLQQLEKKYFVFLSQHFYIEQYKLHSHYPTWNKNLFASITLLCLRALCVFVNIYIYALNRNDRMKCHCPLIPSCNRADRDYMLLLLRLAFCMRLVSGNKTKIHDCDFYNPKSIYSQLDIKRNLIQSDYFQCAATRMATFATSTTTTPTATRKRVNIYSVSSFFTLK